MGHKGFLGSAAAGVSLFAAVAVLLVVVSAYLGFRGWENRNVEGVSQEARLAPAPRIETPPARPVVVGSGRKRSRKADRASSRTADPGGSDAAPIRSSGGSVAVVRRPSASATVPAGTRRTPAPAPSVSEPEPEPDGTSAAGRPAPAPVADAVDDVTAPVGELADRVGDVLHGVGETLP